MPSVKTLGIVLRHADYGEYDRMVTLLSPEMGRVDAIARGCRRPKSQLVSAVELFTSGEFVLYRSRDRYSIEQCQVRESFYDLRSDYDKLLHGVYWLKLLETAVVPDEPAPDLFMLTLRALTFLNHSELPPEMLTMAFEMHFMNLIGLAPRADACVRCGRLVEGDAGFDANAGGVVCAHCDPNAPVIANGARRVLFKLPQTRFESVQKLEGYPYWQEAARCFRKYVAARLPQAVKFAPALPQEGKEKHVGT